MRRAKVVLALVMAGLVRARSVLLISSMALLIGGACATSVSPRGAKANGPSSSASSFPTPSNLHEPVVPDWDHPFSGHGIQVSTAEAAQAMVQFTVHDPSGLGEPSIYVAPDNPPDAVIFVFRSPTFGQAWVVESVPSIADDALRLRAYQGLVAQNGKDGYLYIFEIESIRSGATALAGSSSDPENLPTTIQWVENGTEFEILGRTISTDQGIEIANGI